MTLQSITDASFEVDVLDHDGPVLVDFWASWCLPCKMLEKVLEEVNQVNHNPKFKIVKLNVEENPKLTDWYDVVNIPTLIVFEGDEAVKRIIGAKPKRVILSELSWFLGL